MVFEAIHILIWHLLTGNVSLNTVQPFVEIIQIFTGLSELFLNRLLKFIMLKQAKQQSFPQIYDATPVKNDIELPYNSVKNLSFMQHTKRGLKTKWIKQILRGFHGTDIFVPFHWYEISHVLVLYGTLLLTHYKSKQKELNQKL